MDAHALLTSQGWRGTGHSLHPTSDKTGLSRPLLVSQKQNNLGVGKKQHKTSDMWWMNAFDKSLQGLDTSKEGTVVQTITSGGLDMVAKGGAKFVGNGGGLYASFVRGESLSGTITPEEKGEEIIGEKMGKPLVKKRKRDEVEETKEERKARKAAKRALKAQESAVGDAKPPAVVENCSGAESKEERRERRRQKKLRKAAEAGEATHEEQDEKSTEKLETKEERKERRRQKRLLRQTKVVPLDASEKAKKKKRRKE